MRFALILSKLKESVSPREFENFMLQKDIPIVKELSSVVGHRLLKAAHEITGQGERLFDYVELVEISDFGKLRVDTQLPQMQQISAEFKEYLASPPLFLLLEEVDQ